MTARITIVLLLASLIACGKKGPPLAPLHLVPNVVTNVDARRSGDTVRIRFAVPTSNLNGPGPVAIDRIEIYAVTLGPGAATLPNRELLTATYRVGTISVRPAPVEGEPAPQNAVADTRPAPGEVAEFTEQLTAEKLQPIVRPEPPAAPPAPAAPVPTYASRTYVMRGLTKGGRPGQPSARVQLALVQPPSPPSDIKGRFTETAVGLDWTAPATVEGGAPPVYNVYSADGAAPLNPAPITEPKFERAGAEYGKEQCFVVRTVTVIGSVPIESEPSRPECVTPKDIFPPAAPQRLQVVPAPGVMNLSWEPNSEADLAGYIVLRGDAPGDTLQALTPEPITATRFEDKTARPGSRYVYAVVAVDRATPRNTSAFSNRIEETAR